MRTLIYTLVLGVSAHLAAGQNFRDSKSQEFRFDDYKFLPSPFNPNFLQDPARLKPNIEPQGKQLHGFNSGLNNFHARAIQNMNRFLVVPTARCTLHLMGCHF